MGDGFNNFLAANKNRHAIFTDVMYSRAPFFFSLNEKITNGFSVASEKGFLAGETQQELSSAELSPVGYLFSSSAHDSCISARAGKKKGKVSAPRPAEELVLAAELAKRNNMK